MKDSQSPELALRKVPQQARAKLTWDKILRATAELLDEVGMDGINTNLIADRAGVNISAIYKYFPNKYAILSRLAVQLNDLQTQLTIDYLDSLDESVSWKEMVNGMIDTMVEGTRNEKALMALQSAMLTNPDLKMIYRKSNEEVASVFIRALENYGIELPKNRRKLVGNCMGEIVPAMLDYSVSKGKRFDSRVIDELKRMQVAYIESYIDGITE